MICISFPSGAGGHWLYGLLQKETQQKTVHFHRHSKYIKELNLSHDLDPTKFDFLLSGRYYFNFYLNVIFKYFNVDKNLFRDNYTVAFNKTYETAQFIKQYESLENRIFFNFDDLLYNDKNFYQKVIAVQQQIGIDPVSYQDFVFRKNIYLSTCVNPYDVFENFDNIIWVCYVLAMLDMVGIRPHDETHFYTFLSENQTLCKQFAKKNYHFCPTIDCHFFETNVILPKLL
jgi:hypothetical protein